MNAPLPAHLLPKIAPRPVPAEMIEALKARFGERCSTALVVREQHGRDESPIDAPPPEAVVFCESTEDVAFVVKLADRHAVPVIPFGVGSSLEGHLLAVQGGVSIDLFRRAVSRDGHEVHLTPKEYAVLAELAKQPGRVLSHSHLLKIAWGPAQERQTEYLRVAIRALRQKLEADPKHPSLIINEPAVGYRLIAN